MASAAEKQEQLFEAIETFIRDELESIAPKLKAKTRMFKSAEELSDRRTGAKITHIHTTFYEFLDISSISDNFYQRRLQNHLKDKIYKNLIISILQGHLIPEIRVAALANKSRLKEFDFERFKQGKLKVSIIDGLQRYCCFLIAMYLAAKKETAVAQGFLTSAQYREFEPYLGNTALKTVLEANLRLEVYFNLEVKDLLKYMIIFNTVQKRMSLNHQLEIMEGAILQNLEDNHKATFQRDRQSGSKRNQFTGADIVLAIQAYLQRDHTLSKNSTTDELFHQLKEDESVVDDKIDEVCKAIAIITNKLHPKLVEHFENYDDDDAPKFSNILPNNTLQFLVPMMASLGRFTDLKDDQSQLCKRLNQVVLLYAKGEDLFNIPAYYATTDTIKTSKGSTIKNMTERGFRDLWLDLSKDNIQPVDWGYALKSVRHSRD